MIRFYLLMCALCTLTFLYICWASWPQRHLPGNRVRRIKTRLHLRAHPGRGFATLFELWCFWSKTAMFLHSKRARNDLSFWQRLRHPKEHSVFIGRAHYRHALRILAELHTLILSPPRMGKTAWLARMMLRYPGPLACTSIKDDLFRYTSGIRQRKGNIHVFNPQRIGGPEVPSTFAFNPVHGCQDKQVAIRRAQVLINAVETKGMKDGDWFRDKGAQALEAMLYAAALLAGDLRLINMWVRSSTEEAQERLNADDSPEMASALYELDKSPADKTVATIRMVLSQMFSWMADPALAASVLPLEGLGFDPRAFIRSKDTLYMITTSDYDQSPFAPLFALILSEIKHEATLIAQENRRGRLRRPLGYFLDEIRQTCSVPVDKWLASIGGLGIQIFTVVHDVAQMRSRWGDNGAQIIMDTCGVKVLLPGIQDDKTLESISKICGKVSFRQKDLGHYSEYPVIDEGTLRQLPDKFALIVRANKAPVIARLPRIWNALEYRWAKWLGRDIAELEAVTVEAATAMPARQAPELVGVSITGPAAEVVDALEHGRPLPSWATQGNGNGSSGNGREANVPYPWSGQLWRTRRPGTPQTSPSWQTG